MRPVVQRVAQRMGHRRGKRKKLFLWITVASHKALVHSIGPHRPPLVVVVIDPHIKQVSKLAVVRNVCRRQVVVVVDDRLIRSEAVIELNRCLVGQNKIVVNEVLCHCDSLKLRFLVVWPTAFFNKA